MIWIIFFLPILLWLCLRVLYKVRRLRCVFVSVLGWLRSILIKTLQVCSLCFSCLLILLPHSGISSVYAQTETPTPGQTPTPTSTFSPLTNPSGDAEDRNVICPDGQPAGWGSVTPSPKWLMECGQCITPVSSYDWGDDFDFGDNPFIPTPTITPTLDPLMKANYAKACGYNIVDGGIQDACNELYLANSTNGGLLEGWWYIKGRATTKCDNGIICSQAGAYIRNEVHNAAGTIHEFEYYCEVDDNDGHHVVQGQNTGGNVYLGTAPLGVIYDGEYECNIRTLVTAGNTYHQMRFSVRVDSGYYYHNEAVYPDELEYRPYPFEREIGGDPTSTPDADYCANVNADGENYDPLNPDDDPNFNMGGFYVGTAQCFTIGGFEIPIEWMNNFVGSSFSNPTLPGTQWCFTPIEFGYLTVFGVELDLDFYALGMAGILLFRFITRS